MFSQVFVILSLKGRCGPGTRSQHLPLPWDSVSHNDLPPSPCLPGHNTSLPPRTQVTTPPSPRNMVTTPPSPSTPLDQVTAPPGPSLPQDQVTTPPSPSRIYAGRRYATYWNAFFDRSKAKGLFGGLLVVSSSYLV